MMAISFPPLIAHAIASDRMVLLSGPVMIFPALRSQMNCSFGTPSTSGSSGFSRTSMHVSATTGNSLSNSAGCKPALRVARQRAVIGIYDGFEQAHRSRVAWLLPRLSALRTKVEPLIQLRAARGTKGFGSFRSGGCG